MGFQVKPAYDKFVEKLWNRYLPLSPRRIVVLSNRTLCDNTSGCIVDLSSRCTYACLTRSMFTGSNFRLPNHQSAEKTVLFLELFMVFDHSVLCIAIIVHTKNSNFDLNRRHMAIFPN